MQFISNAKTKQLAIPQDWLVPPKDAKEEEGSYVSSFAYNKEVQSFPVGNGKIALHISSYTVQEEGSARRQQAGTFS